MRDTVVTTEIDRPIQEVWDHLDRLANHEAFTDHMLADWRVTGPTSGIGASVNVRANMPGPENRADIKVLEAEPPKRIMEESVGAKGRRRTRGTYTLEEAADGGTLIRFTLETLELPRSERLIAPLLRGWLQRGNAKAMERLKTTLAERQPASAR